jgi:hypothetical protein
MKINTSIRMDADAGGRDPDSYSLQLATYHQQLWSKPLPSGSDFSLTIKGRSRLVTLLEM